MSDENLSNLESQKTEKTFKRNKIIVIGLLLLLVISFASLAIWQLTKSSSGKGAVNSVKGSGGSREQTASSRTDFGSSRDQTSTSRNPDGGSSNAPGITKDPAGSSQPQNPSTPTSTGNKTPTGTGKNPEKNAGNNDPLTENQPKTLVQNVDRIYFTYMNKDDNDKFVSFNFFSISSDGDIKSHTDNPKSSEHVLRFSVSETDHPIFAYAAKNKAYILDSKDGKPKVVYDSGPSKKNEETNSIIIKIAISPDGKHLALVDGNDATQVKFIDIANGKVLDMHKFDSLVSELKYSANNDKLFILTSAKGALYEMSINDHQKASKVREFGKHSTSIKISPDGQKACDIISGNKVVFTSFEPDRKRIEFNEDKLNIVNILGWSRDSSKVFLNQLTKTTTHLMEFSFENKKLTELKDKNGNLIRLKPKFASKNDLKPKENKET